MTTRVNREEILAETDKFLAEIDEVIEVPRRFDWSRIDEMNRLGFGWNIQVGRKEES